MNEKQLKEFLCDNLSIAVHVDSWTDKITVGLFVCNRLVSEWTDSLPEHPHPNA